MTAMSVDATMARISAIQARMVAVGVLPPVRTAVAPPAARPASTPFAVALSDAQSGAAAGVTGAQVVGSAEKYLDVPYVFGGTSNSGLDCSGLVQKAYGDLGIALPRTAAEQAKVGTAVPGLAQAQPGDILTFG